MPKLVLALDVHRSSDINVIVDSMPGDITWYKVGLELFSAEGPGVFAALQERDKNVFLDLKLHDIPRTVERAVRAIARHKVQMLTIHASGGKAMLQAAADAAHEIGAGAPKLIAVTTLTSLDQQDLVQLGIHQSIRDRALALGEMALDAGVDGLVTSVDELKALRNAFGDDPIMVTPGIRMPIHNLADQKRAATPARAVREGSDFLVVGRPILEAENPPLAAQKILEDMRGV
ncbi:MAG: orotidine-5'-phosphate decarboxylase [Kiritimatiellae bacterium]|nr:orotidine-5'-phosphate decarboxylase [Kiritimatiellia bacterium]